jgi:hypothetical protein
MAVDGIHTNQDVGSGAYKRPTCDLIYFDIPAWSGPPINSALLMQEHNIHSIQTWIRDYGLHGGSEIPKAKYPAVHPRKPFANLPLSTAFLQAAESQEIWFMQSADPQVSRRFRRLHGNFLSLRCQLIARLDPQSG